MKVMGEKCWCGKHAVVKIGQEWPSNPHQHNATAYLCQDCGDYALHGKGEFRSSVTINVDSMGLVNALRADKDLITRAIADAVAASPSYAAGIRTGG